MGRGANVGSSGNVGSPGRSGRGVGVSRGTGVSVGPSVGRDAGVSVGSAVGVSVGSAVGVSVASGVTSNVDVGVGVGHDPSTMSGLMHSWADEIRSNNSSPRVTPSIQSSCFRLVIVHRQVMKLITIEPITPPIKPLLNAGLACKR